MSVQDKVERILKEIHILFSEGQEVSGESENIIVNRKDVFSLLEKLNLSMYEVMDNYEATARSRELSVLRSEKKEEQIVERANRQVEDIYAAALVYTEDALGRAHRIMADATAEAQQIYEKMNMEFEDEKRRVKENQSELREQLQDFKDSQKYLGIIEDSNRQREKEHKEKNGSTKEKRIQNESKHYAINEKPEIKVNPAYFERKKTLVKETPVVPSFMEEEVALAAEQVALKVDLDAEYFNWQSSEKAVGEGDTKPVIEKKERRFLFGKK